MKKKWLLLVLTLLVMMIFTLPALAEDGPDSPIDTNAFNADCSSGGDGRVDSMGSTQIPFECSQEMTVYFGVCDSGGNPNDDLFEMFFKGTKVAYNAYEGGEEVAYIGSGQSDAGRNVATLVNTQDLDPPATYGYAISPDRGAVESAMNGCSDRPISIGEAKKPKKLADETFEDVMPGDVVRLDEPVKLEESYPTVYYTATWDTGASISTNALTRTSDIIVFDEGGNAVPGTTRRGEGFVEVEIENQPKGNYDVEFDAGDEDFPAGGSDVRIVVATFLSGGGDRRGAIRGTVFEDTNLNGVYDEGEIGIGGVDIILETPGEEDYPFYTGEDGIYAPVALGPSYYWVQMIVPEGWTPTTETRTDALPILVDDGGNAAVDINFGLVRGGTGGAVVPETLPASGYGPGPDYNLFLWMAIGGLLAGSALVLRARKQRS